MPTKTVTVQYVNPPKDGKPNGSIKTRDGEYYSVPADKLAFYQPGGIHDIEFTEETGRDGRVWRTIGSGKKTGDAPRGGGRPMGPRETSPTDAERMFVCSLINAAIQAGQLKLGGADIKDAVETLRAVWSSTFGSKTDAPTAGPRCIADALIAGIRMMSESAKLLSWMDADAFKASVNLMSEADRQVVRDEAKKQLSALRMAERAAA